MGYWWVVFGCFYLGDFTLIITLLWVGLICCLCFGCWFGVCCLFGWCCVFSWFCDLFCLCLLFWFGLLVCLLVVVCFVFGF